MRHVDVVAFALVGAALVSCGQRATSGGGVVLPASPKAEPAPTVSTPKAGAIPPQFLGRWASSNELCNDPSSDDRAMVVEPAAVTFWESSGRVLGSTSESDRRLVLHLSYSDNDYEDDDPPSTDAASTPLDLTLELSPDQATLAVLRDGEAKDVRYRCPA
jgi:hypothetical protein